MRTVWLKLSIFAPKKLYGGRTVNRSEIPHYAYTWPLVAMAEQPTPTDIFMPKDSAKNKKAQGIG